MSVPWFSAGPGVLGRDVLEEDLSSLFFLSRGVCPVPFWGSTTAGLRGPSGRTHCGSFSHNLGAARCLRGGRGVEAEVGRTHRDDARSLVFLQPFDPGPFDERSLDPRFPGGPYGSPVQRPT